MAPHSPASPARCSCTACGRAQALADDDALLRTEIVCPCTMCVGRRALVGGDGCGLTAVMRHNLVQLAHSPAARARSVQRFGPWAAPADAVG